MTEQLMADLPPDGAEPAPPFTNVGFDVFGPWTIQTRQTRGGAANSKRWGLVFTCMSSRAVHIEVLETLNSASFLCALRRFLALRGPVALLRCDHGTNFIGGKSELDEAVKEMDQASLERYLSKHNCKWILTYRMPHTLVAPGNARLALSVPFPGNFMPQDHYARKRWRRVQYLAEQFLTRWRRDYLQNLQIKKKWNEKRRNLTVGDIVLLKEDNAHRNHWPMARVAEVFASDDGQVRKAKVTVHEGGQTKSFQRPVCELVQLVPTDSS